MAENGRTRKADALLAAARAKGLSIALSADAAGISERTAYRRLKDPEVQRMIGELHEQVLTEIMGKMVSEAPAVMEGLMKHVRADSQSVSLQGIKLFFVQLLKMRQQLDTEQRLSQVEKHLRPRRAKGK